MEKYNPKGQYGYIQNFIMDAHLEEVFGPDRKLKPINVHVSKETKADL